MPPKKSVAAASSISDAPAPAVPSEDTPKKRGGAGGAGALGIPIKVNTNDSDRLQLAQSINNLVVRGEAFASALTELNQFSREKLVQLDTMIEAKKREYQDLMTSLENQYKDFEIKLKQNLHENKLVAVKEVLDPLNMMACDVPEYERLTTEVAACQAKTQQELAKAIAEEKAAARSSLEQQANTMTLSHRAEIATLKAQVEQQIKEISVLNDTIKGLKFELAEQRNLTKEVAQAGAKGSINQTFSK